MTGRRARKLSGLLGIPLTVGVIAAVSTAPAYGAPASAAPQPRERVVVTGADGADGAAAAVRAAGGTVLDELPFVSGVSAELPVGTRLAGHLVAADRPLTVASAGADADPEASGSSDAGPTDGPRSSLRQTLGLTGAGPAGAGVTVAVVDTGVADVGDLAGRVAHVDVTGRRIRTGTGDGYGHGTFMAGLVAGDGAASAGRFAGVAPQAAVLDVRVAAADGSTSLVSVLRGLQVVAASADALDIRVLNLSLSSGSPLPYQVDPLTQALESLWHQGITVVTAAGNEGPTGTVSSPGLDPTLLTAGALDDAGTADRADDTVAPYSSRAVASSPTNGKPDLVAPGSHLVSLRAPGSQVDTENPGSRVDDAYFRGSGTSMATAVVSGVVADLLSARPELGPDQVKALLTGTAYRTAALEPADGAGAGAVDAGAALAAPAPAADDGTAGAQDPTAAPDPASLTPSQVELWDRFAAALLDGDRKRAAAAWSALPAEMRATVDRAWAALSPEARSWVGRSWVGRSWVGADGTADAWLARSWVARSWVARSWVGRSWVGRSWVGRSWVGRSWVGRSWVEQAWAGRSWVGRSWVDGDWTGSSWTGSSWTTADWS